MNATLIEEPPPPVPAHHILQALIVDDEELARQRIRDLLISHSNINVCGECRNGLEAVEKIRDDHPDIVFLDINMPDVDGFGVIGEVGRDHMPVVIFVSAYDQFAVRAFDEAAVDYLLKPYDRERFDHAVERALERFKRQEMSQLEDRMARLVSLAREHRPSRPFADRLVVRQGGTLHLLKVEDIDWVESARNYVKVHTARETYVMRETLSNIESRLDGDRFLRIHRSTLVNVDRIRRIEPGYGTESRLELEDGTKLVISRAYRRGKVKDLLQDLV